MAAATLILVAVAVPVGAQPGGAGESDVADGAGALVGEVREEVEGKIVAGDVPIMPVDEVRIGMKGYGLTVFHGTRIEAFPVEVISIVGNSTPRQRTVWIRCPDERMQESGPVQGMSGSPIFLWEEGVEGELGKGGRMIGAFAFGYAFAKDCLVGVQPIEYMREAAGRVEAEDEDLANHVQRPSHAGTTLAAIARLSESARLGGATPLQRYRMDGVRRLLARGLGERDAPSEDAEGTTRRAGGAMTVEAFLSLNQSDTDDRRTPSRAGVMLATSAAPARVEGSGLPEASPGDRSPDMTPRVEPMMLPLSVRSPVTASAMAPVLRDVGLYATAVSPNAPGLGNTPPPGFDVDAVRIEPGSVLAIPLAFGDADYSAIGTVTDVLPDGRVLGFGHAMFAEGDTAMPLATGYVHFVVPSIQTSFKQGGSYQIVGSILQDETVGISGDARTAYATTPVRLRVNLPRQPQRTFNYTLVDHPMLSPQIAAMLVLDSLSSAQALPRENTLRMRASYTFTGDRTLTLDSTMPGGDVMSILWEVYPLLGAMVNNPHQPLSITDIDIRFDVEDGIRAGVITNATLDQAEVTPGSTVGVTLQIQPYAKDPITRRVTFKVPKYLEEGDYEFVIGDASTYSSFLFYAHPELSVTENVDELFETVQQMLSVQEDALYVMMPLPREGLAIGRQTLPRLPSSVQAMIVTPTTTVATPYAEAYSKKVDTDLVVQGAVGFTLAVRGSGG